MKMIWVAILLQLCPLIAEARLGEDIKQCSSRYGDILQRIDSPDGHTTHIAFSKGDYFVEVIFSDGTAVCETFAKGLDKPDLTTQDVVVLASLESPISEWTKAEIGGLHVMKRQTDDAIAVFGPSETLKDPTDGTPRHQVMIMTNTFANSRLHPEMKGF